MSRKIGYFQCVGGASGDMVLGALVDCGLDLDCLRRVVSSLGIDRVELRSERGQRRGVLGTQVTVLVEQDAQRRHSIRDFIEMVEGSGLPSQVVASSIDVLRRIGNAEAKVHGVLPDDVCLHELGSLDTVIDITCTVMGLAELCVDVVCSSPIPTGSGFIDTDHGRMSVPAPATLALLTEVRAPIVPPPGNCQDAGEMVTPTGAALLTTLATFEQPEMIVETSGFGLGSRDPNGYPNALGFWIGSQDSSESSLILLETNVDDESPQILSYTVERLLALGAKDAWLTSAQMKKGRAGVVLSALVSGDLEKRATELIMTETTTLGIRSTRVRRHEAEREQMVVHTVLGHVPVKVKRLDGVIIDVSPEYESAKTLALENRLPLREVMKIVRRATVDVMRSEGLAD